MSQVVGFNPIVLFLDLLAGCGKPFSLDVVQTPLSVTLKKIDHFFFFTGDLDDGVGDLLLVCVVDHFPFRPIQDHHLSSGRNLILGGPARLFFRIHQFVPDLRRNIAVLFHQILKSQASRFPTEETDDLNFGLQILHHFSTLLGDGIKLIFRQVKAAVIAKVQTIQQDQNSQHQRDGQTGSASVTDPPGSQRCSDFGKMRDPIGQQQDKTCVKQRLRSPVPLSLDRVNNEG